MTARRPRSRPSRGRPLAPIPAELLEEDPVTEDSVAADRGVWSLGAYLRATRRPAFNVVYVVLLLAIYEGGLLLVDEGRRNAADVILKGLFRGFGAHAVTVFHAVLLTILVVVGGNGVRRGEAHFRWFLPFLIETSFYAALLSPIVVFLNVPFLARPGGDLLLDLGAGVYEEVLFRFLVIQGLFLVIRLDPWHRIPAQTTPNGKKQAPHVGAVAVIVLGSAALFAAYHHVGAGAEPLTAPIFIFRAVAGLVLALIYLSRGLAVAVYTHAFYDVLLHALA